MIFPSALLLVVLAGVGAKNWLISLYPKYADEELQQVKSWLETNGIKVDEVISEYQLRVILIDASDEQVKTVEASTEMMHFIESIEEEELEL